MSVGDGTNYLSDEQAKKAILEIGARMYRRGMVAGNDGNISVRVSPNGLWVTPTGVSKGFMSPDMLIKSDMSGNIIEGTMMYSSELLMHIGIYMECSSVKSVVHAHPPVSTSFAIAGINLDAAILTEAVLGIGVVPVAPYATPGTQEVPDSITPFVRDYSAVLLANHGLVTWDADPFDAYSRMEMIEHYATTAIYSSFIIGRVNELSEAQTAPLNKRRADNGIVAGGVMRGVESETNLGGFISMPIPGRK